MNLADKLTFSRIVFAPVFFALYFLPKKLDLPPASSLWIIPILWLIFIVAEITDGLDGMAARKMGQTSDFGRLFDPFADTLLQLTLFLCFVLDGLFPAALFLVVIYREFSILFIRNLMLKKGIAMGARLSGKAKTVLYIAACAFALAHASLTRLALFPGLHSATGIAALSVFALSVLASVLSFLDYLSVYRSRKES